MIRNNHERNLNIVNHCMSEKFKITVQKIKHFRKKGILRQKKFREKILLKVSNPLEIEILILLNIN